MSLSEGRRELLRHGSNIYGAEAARRKACEEKLPVCKGRLMPAFSKTIISFYALLFVLIIVLLGVEAWRMRERYASASQEFEKRYSQVIVFVPQKDVPAGALLDSVNLDRIYWQKNKLEKDMLVSPTEFQRYRQHRAIVPLPAGEIVRRSQLTDQPEND